MPEPAADNVPPPEKGMFDHQSFLANLTTLPGVYQMIDERGDVIYVGKARNLKKRVSSYFHKQDHSPKTQVMVAQICDVQIIVTASEHEALVLENQLIKKFRPRYNVVFRDDKSYPYIYLSGDRFPRLSIHRGKQRAKGDYYGPFTGSSAARFSINLMQKLFNIRSCEDSVFRHRSRPCLQYQIKRCSAPCVGLISEQEYARDVAMVRMFYQGKNQQVIAELTQRMETASQQLEFESAARFRDQIIALRRVLEKQSVDKGNSDADVIVADIKDNLATVFVLQIRNGLVQGNRVYFPTLPAGADLDELLNSFVAQYYHESAQTIPNEIIIDRPLAEEGLLASWLSEQCGRQVRIAYKVRQQRAEWLQMAKRSLQQQMQTRLQAKIHISERLSALMLALSLDKLPVRMECFDISHTRGEATVASCVVFDKGVAKKSEYRRFNIKNVQPGDDYAAIEQAVRRRYSRQVREQGKLPDLLIIDGGQGQLAKAVDAMSELGLEDVPVISVAKGPERKAGMEQIHLAYDEKAILTLPADSPALHLIQTIRDEAHRFAIVGHRAQRDKKRRVSRLEDIPGVGAKRRRALLNHFGGLQEIKRAGVKDLTLVPGINQALAQVIFDHLHG